MPTALICDDTFGRVLGSMLCAAERTSAMQGARSVSRSEICQPR